MEDIYATAPNARTLEGFIEGLHILGKYMQPKEVTPFGGEHDIIWFAVEDHQLAEDSEDGRKLSSLGFHISADFQTWAYFT